MIEILLDAGLWFPAAIAVGAAAVAVLLVRWAGRPTPRRIVGLAALHLMYGCFIGMAGLGHVVAVTIEAVQGTLEDGLTWNLYPIGLVLAVPGFLLAACAARMRREPESTRRILTALDVWLILALAVMGPSAALAVPALLNLVALYIDRRGVSRAVIASSAVAYVLLFVAVLVRGGGGF